MRAWISVTAEEEAQGELQKVYESVKKARGSLSNVMQVQSLDPNSIQLHLNLYLHLMFGKSSLSRLEREMIAVAVSQSNQCNYCVIHHSEALSSHTKDSKLLDTIRNLGGQNLSTRQRAMIDYAVKLTRHPSEIIEADLEALRKAGFSDNEILRVNLIVSYFNFANRIVSGLGVPLEDKQARTYKY